MQKISIDKGYPRCTVFVSCIYAMFVFFLLFFALGQRALSGSEDRWAEIARNMLLYGDAFHPIINGEIYFDKPLLSYWVIVLASFATQGLNELAVRLPGALSALVTILCSYKVAAALFDRRVAWLSSILIITSYGLLFWSHTASAEASNLALIMAAIAWFVYRRERTDFSSYTVFYLLCAIGCQLKGLTAIAVPILAILPFLLRNGRWKPHVNRLHFTAILLALGVFFLPYLVSTLHALPAGIEAQSRSGIDLVFRENIVRFFEPFDHKDPVYSYLYNIPRILFPWMFLFLGALAYYIPKYRQLGGRSRWLLEIIVITFLFFTFSGSRRWYYILPTMPFCMILISAYLLEADATKWKHLSLQATAALVGMMSLLLVVFPLALKAYARAIPLPNEFSIGSATMLAGSVGIFWLGKSRGASLQKMAGFDNSCASEMLVALMGIAAVVMIVIFGFVLPGADRFRQLKPFALALAEKIKPSEKVVFYGTSNTTIAFYLNAKNPIPLIKKRSDLSQLDVKWIVIVDEGDKNNLHQSFPELYKKKPFLEEKQFGPQIPEKFGGSRALSAAYQLPQE